MKAHHGAGAFIAVRRQVCPHRTVQPNGAGPAPVQTDMSLDQNEHAEQETDEANLLNSEELRVKHDAAVDTSAEADDKQQFEFYNEEPESLTEELGESPNGEGDMSFESNYATVEPLELQPKEPKESSLQRILRMAYAAGIVIDPTPVDSMVNRPPLLTAMCPGPPELRALLSHCRA